MEILQQSAANRWRDGSTAVCCLLHGELLAWLLAPLLHDFTSKVGSGEYFVLSSAGMLE